MSFNENFKMGLGEIDVIEDSLRYKLNSLSKDAVERNANDVCVNDEMEKIHSVLGQLHNQKIWYRPKTSVYVSG